MGNWTEVGPLFCLKPCKIHKKTDTFLKFIMWILNEVDKEKHSILFAYNITRDCFELFGALTEHHLLNQSLQFKCVTRNDLYYLSNYAAILSFLYRARLSDDNFSTFADFTILFQQKADCLIQDDTVLVH
ncbi:hypothetical protein RF11_11981 [Thelohanellus kitauei]|uniref:Uncharacterized protein n=1 Tax=Thelohanellus kitauei TaxID=669202 RepID=A0A0C2IL67_THEKT|nr:hypothetical protein RF11_11981 [Thelohanellus kitauei]